MTPEHFRTIRQEAGLSLSDMAALLRISDRSTIHRWEKGQRPISGPASIICELIATNTLPTKFYTEAGVKV